MDVLGIVIIALLIIAVVIWITTIPITIAKSRGVTGSELSTITCLSWVSLLVGVTWIVALVLALTYKPKRWVDKDRGATNFDLDALEKLHQLKSKGVLSEAEYLQEKRKLMGQIDQIEEEVEENNYTALERLYNLKQNGILSDAEYEKEKQKLVGFLDKNEEDDSSENVLDTKKADTAVSTTVTESTKWGEVLKKLMLFFVECFKACYGCILNTWNKTISSITKCFKRNPQKTRRKRTKKTTKVPLFKKILRSLFWFCAIVGLAGISWFGYLILQSSDRIKLPFETKKEEITETTWTQIKYENGQVKQEGELDNTNQKNGVWKEYTEDGKLKRRISYKNGKLEGNTEEYYPSGRLKTVYPFENDQLHGLVKQYDENSNLVAEIGYNNGVKKEPKLLPEVNWDDVQHFDYWSESVKKLANELYNECAHNGLITSDSKLSIVIYLSGDVATERDASLVRKTLKDALKNHSAIEFVETYDNSTDNLRVVLGEKTGHFWIGIALKNKNGVLKAEKEKMLDKIQYRRIENE